MVHWVTVDDAIDEYAIADWRTRPAGRIAQGSDRDD
jgi:hypothetical protein